MAKRQPKRQSPDEIRQRITQMMIDALNDGTPPWRKPWSASINTGIPCNFRSKRQYNGINPIILMFVSMFSGYSSKFWGSASAWGKVVGVETSEAPAYVTFFSLLPKVDPKTGQKQKTKTGKDILIPILREFPVLNAEQMQPPSVKKLLERRDLRKLAAAILPKRHPAKKSWPREKVAQAIHDTIQLRLNRYLASAGADLNNEPDFQPAEDFIAKTGANIGYHGGSAYYSQGIDKITVPPKRKFESMADFYETVFHELGHWAEHPDRVGVKKQDKDVSKYAFSELVAEITACLLLVELHVPMAEKMLENSKGYIKSWMQGMKNDPKFIFDAAQQASKVIDFLMGRSKVEATKEKGSALVAERAA